MQLSEFTKAPRGPYLFDFWVHPVTILSPLGAFSVELYPEAGEPDNKMVEEAKRLTLFVQSHPKKLSESVFAHYERVLEYPDWLESCQVPTDLTKNDLSHYMRVLNLAVRRDGIEGHFIYESCVYISPQWDAEHAIYLEVSGSEVAFRES